MKCRHATGILCSAPGWGPRMLSEPGVFFVSYPAFVTKTIVGEGVMACWRQLRTDALLPPPLFIHGHPGAKPDTQFGSDGPARFGKPLCSQKVPFRTLWLSNCLSYRPT